MMVLICLSWGYLLEHPMVHFQDRIYSPLFSKVHMSKIVCFPFFSITLWLGLLIWPLSVGHQVYFEHHGYTYNKPMQKSYHIWPRIKPLFFEWGENLIVFSISFKNVIHYVMVKNPGSKNDDCIRGCKMISSFVINVQWCNTMQDKE